MLVDVLTVIEPPGALDGPSRTEPLPHTTVGDEGAALDPCGPGGNPDGRSVTVVAPVVLGAAAGPACEPPVGWVVDSPSATIGIEALELANPLELVDC